jgi:hypothetical protein
VMKVKRIMNHESMIEFRKIGEEEGMLCIDVSASNGLFSSSSATFWLQPGELIDFGKRLQGFPKHMDIHDEIIISYGKDNEGSHGYLFLRFYIYDQVGHVGIEVKMRLAPIEGDRHGSMNAAQAHFSIPTLVARINDLGRAIVSWVGSEERELLYTL